MTTDEIAKLKEDFGSWSGGFPPSGEEEITVYIDYAADATLDANEVRQVLRDWMNDPTNLSDFLSGILSGKSDSEQQETTVVKKHHPEQGDDEIFMGNMSDPAQEYRMKRSPWDGSPHLPGWKTVRLGKTAYDIYGKVLEFMIPIFIKRSEVEEALKRTDLFEGQVEVWTKMLEVGSCDFLPGKHSLTFGWNGKIWTIESHNATHAFIRSGSITSQIELRMLPKVAEIAA